MAMDSIFAGIFTIGERFIDPVDGTVWRLRYAIARFGYLSRYGEEIRRVDLGALTAWDVWTPRNTGPDVQFLVSQNEACQALKRWNR